jgi:transcriptional regulator with XRE-family HTH domain
MLTVRRGEDPILKALSQVVYYEPMSPITIRLREEREKRGLSQPKLAKAAGVRQATISDIEHGKIAFTLDTLEKLARALGVPALSLLVETPAKRKPRRKP